MTDIRRMSKDDLDSVNERTPGKPTQVSLNITTVEKSLAAA
jgi:hypothetical protein